MNAEQLIKDSMKVLGHGMFEQLAPVITHEGEKAGWSYTYPIGINRGGQRYKDLGLTLDDLIEAGYARLELQGFVVI